MTFLYSAYSLTIASDLSLPDLRTASATDLPDVAIRFGEVPIGAPEGTTQLGPFLWVGQTRFRLEVPGIARYLVEDGSRITIAPAPGIDEDSIRLFLLGSSFGALLFQRGHMVLHGNAIRIGDQVLVGIGPSGAGKSTLAAAFARRGYDVLADDVVPLDRDGRVLPGVPRIKLWRDATDHLGIDATGLDRIRPGMEKFSFPLPGQFTTQPLPLRWVYMLSNDNAGTIRLDPISGMLRFVALKDNTYRHKFLDGMAFKSEHLRLCGRIAGQVRLAKVTRPRGQYALDALVDTILADVAAHP